MYLVIYLSLFHVHYSLLLWSLLMGIVKLWNKNQIERWKPAYIIQNVQLCALYMILLCSWQSILFPKLVYLVVNFSVPKLYKIFHDPPWMEFSKSCADSIIFQAFCWSGITQEALSLVEFYVIVLPFLVWLI